MKTHPHHGTTPHPIIPAPRQSFHSFARQIAWPVRWISLFLCCLANLSAQTLTDQSASTAPSADSVVQIVAQENGLSLASPDQLPRGGTYYVMIPGGINGLMAIPWPCPPLDPTLPIFSITDNIFIVDDTGGVVLPLPHSLGRMTSSAAITAAVAAESNAVVTVINQVLAAQAPQLTTMALRADGQPVPEDDTGGGSFAPNDVTNSFPVFQPGTNLWIARTAFAAGYLTGIGSNTLADVSYELQSRTNLLQTDWQSEGFFPGSELTNWTPFSVWQGQRPNLFIRLRSWVDTDDIGIPDWWQLMYFGYVGIDPNASAANDGYSNLQKFDMGLNPTNYYNPNGPPGFFGYLDATGTNVFIAWNAAPGPVVNYSLQRGISNALSGLYVYSQIGTLSSNATLFKDVGAINNSNAWNNVYNLEAVYPGGSLSATDTWQVNWYGPYGTLGAPYGPPAPTNFYACADTTATNVLLSWSRASGIATNYLIERGIFDSTSSDWVYHIIASVSAASNSFVVNRPFTNSDNWSDNYSLVAIYPGNVQAPWATSPVNVGNANGLAGPGNFFGYADGTGTNLVLTWTTAAATPTNYVIFAGTTNEYGTCAYVKLTMVSGSATSLLVTNGYNNLYDAYAIFATYTNGSMSQAAFWQSANGTPTPGNFTAYFDATGTNVWLSWAKPAGTITGYQIVRKDPDSEGFTFNLNSNTASLEDVNAVNYGDFDAVNTFYTLQAFYPKGGASTLIWTTVGTPPSPTNLLATLDATGKNVTVTWNAVLGAIGYVIDRGVLNPATGNYSYSQIATVGAGITSYIDAGAITTPNSYNNHYKVATIFPGSVKSAFNDSSISESSNIPLSNVYVTANLIRNGSGRWQIMFSGLPTNSAQTVQLTWYGWTGDTYGEFFQQNLSTANLSNGIYQIPDADIANLLGFYLTVQLFGPNGEPGRIETVGYVPDDAPYFVDGRQHMKQNLEFLIRAAPINELFFNPSNAANDSLSFDGYGGQYNQTETSFEEFSFIHHAAESLWEDFYYFQLDNLWPFTANYELANYLVDTTRTGGGIWAQSPSVPYGSTNFTFQLNFATNIPAQPILAQANPYWILQPGFGNYYYIIWDLGGSPGSSWGLTMNSDDTSVRLNSSGGNLFGLPFSSGCVISETNFAYTYQSLALGNSLTVTPGNVIADYASWCPSPTLVLSNYYFAPLIGYGTTILFPDISGLAFPGEIGDSLLPTVQPFPLPIEDDFNVTNQSPPLIATVGQPMVIAGWAKYSIHGSSPTKYAYLGQYFVTNAFLLNSNGIVTTNTAGVMSPYGEFFPLQTGTAQFLTMPDIDNPSQQGTGVVKIVSMNVDANHDGILDTSYAGPDQVSSSRPFRFWANDDRDIGDDAGNYGIPEYLPASLQDASRIAIYNTTIPVPGAQYASTIANAYAVNGRRDLVDFFPVYLNIGSLFQSNALSVGINPNDPSYQFALSQADGVLRFVYTSLTPTNYMNFLLDTNESGTLAAPATTVWPILPQGTLLGTSFLSGIATNNQGIILVEAAAPTTQPLVLTIYHGTNQIAQTSLYLSITGVEHMFRSKTIYLNSAPITVPDRLTDASVPNEPDTIDKNFVFLHGYNVNTNEARGVASDMYKRMYWSGSHAKFWAVTWEGADSKIGSIFTPNYQTNVGNAFLTAPLVATFIASLTNSGPVVTAAHSLGNVVVLSAISDWNAPISQYFMMDSAVPIESIDASATTNMMVLSTWTAYTNRLFASQWYQLFPATDARNSLSWNNRLGNIGAVDVYNFYSSGEDVLRTYPNDPPPDMATLPAGKVGFQLAMNLFSGHPFGTYSWYWQEKGKGTCQQDWFLGSSHGGWQFNDWVYGTNSIYYPTTWWHMSPSVAATLTTNQLRTNAFFAFASSYFACADTNLQSASGNAYALANRNQILSDAIPAMSMVAGANPVPKFTATEHNLDMMALKNGWSSSRTGSEANMWHHSDFVQMAYTFTHRLFDTFVTTGNLK